MGWDPKSEQLRELTPEFLEENPEANLWQLFREGETVLIKREADVARPFRAKFRIEELSANRIVLVAVGKIDELKREHALRRMREMTPQHDRETMKK